MQEMSVHEVNEVNGGNPLLVLGSAAVVYKEAYETATFFGAGELGAWIGSSLYDALN